MNKASISHARGHNTAEGRPSAPAKRISVPPEPYSEVTTAVKTHLISIKDPVRARGLIEQTNAFWRITQA